MDAELRMPIGRLPWRSLRIAIPMSIKRADWNIRWPLYERDLCRAITRHIARSLGLDPRKRTRIQGRSTMGQYLGYVLLYRGEPSDADQQLFMRAKLMANLMRNVAMLHDPPRYYPPHYC